MARRAGIAGPAGGGIVFHHWGVVETISGERERRRGEAATGRLGCAGNANERHLASE